MSRTRATKVPAIPVPTGDIAFSNAVKEALDVGLGRSGDRRDAFVRMRDLIDSGLVTLPYGTGSGPLTIRPGTDGDGESPIFLNPSTPGQNPIPTGHLNVRTEAVWDGIMIKWDWPPGEIEYAFTEVWAAKLVTANTIPTFAQAVLVGTSGGNLFVHQNLGLGAVWYYWLRYVGFATGGGAPPRSLFTPSEGGRGVRGQTAVDPTYVLGVLAGQIGNDQLALGLANRIDLVDYYYDATGARVPVPLVDILGPDGSPTGQRVQNVQNRVLVAIRDVNSDFQAAIAQEASIRVRDDNSIIGAYSVRVDLGGYVAGFGLVATRRPNGTLGTPPESNQFESAFVIRADRFAVVRPRQPNEPADLPEAVPFVVGLVNGVSTVGINGQLVVDGTITARHIQAGSIGTAVLNATEVWASVVSADRVFASSFATAGDLNWRVEIGGQNETYPFWYGRGVRGGPDSVFYFDRNGNTFLAGNLTVSGAGRFSTAGGSGTARVEIGGAAPFVIWVGSGARTEENGVFYVKSDGTPFIRGAPITLPVGSRSGSGQPSCNLTVVAVPGQATVPVLIQGIALVRAGTALFEKTIETKFFNGAVQLAGFATSTQDYTFSEQQFTVVNLAPGNYALRMEVKVTAAAGGNPIPTVSYVSGSMVALQLSSVSA